MLLLSALWLAIVHAFASVALPVGVGGAHGAHVRVVGVETSAPSANGSVHVGRDTAAAIRWTTPPLAGEEFRPAASPRLPALDRATDRSGPPLRSAAGRPGRAPVELTLAPAHLARRWALRVSHAAVSRGGHLPYYPTAPPLQG